MKNGRKWESRKLCGKKVGEGVDSSVSTVSKLFYSFNFHPKKQHKINRYKKKFFKGIRLDNVNGKVLFFGILLKPIQQLRSLICIIIGAMTKFIGFFN